jgi:hypothetical protein
MAGKAIQHSPVKIRGAVLLICEGSSRSICALGSFGPDLARDKRSAPGDSLQRDCLAAVPSPEVMGGLRTENLFWNSFRHFRLPKLVGPTTILPHRATGMILAARP